MLTAKCSACGCAGVHACMGKQVPMTKVGAIVFGNGIAEFVRAYCNHSKPKDVQSGHSIACGIARYTST